MVVRIPIGLGRAEPFRERTPPRRSRGLPPSLFLVVDYRGGPFDSASTSEGEGPSPSPVSTLLNLGGLAISRPLPPPTLFFLKGMNAQKKTTRILSCSLPRPYSQHPTPPPLNFSCSVGSTFNSFFRSTSPEDREPETLVTSFVPLFSLLDLRVFFSVRHLLRFGFPFPTPKSLKMFSPRSPPPPPPQNFLAQLFLKTGEHWSSFGPHNFNE